MEGGAAMWAVTPVNILGWFVFGLIFSVGFNITGWPFRRWA